MIERYDTFNTKRCPDELIFGGFNYQPIPPNYYYFLNGDDDNVNNIPGSTVDDVLTNNKGVENSVVPNDEDIDYDIVIDDDDSPTSDIYPSKTKSCKLKERMRKIKECTHKMKEWKFCPNFSLKRISPKESSHYQLQLWKSQ